MSFNKEFAAEHLRLALQRSEQNIEQMTLEQLQQHAEQILQRYAGSLPHLEQESLQPVIPALVNDIVGFGPLAPLLRDESISEIMVNNYRAIFIERGGQIVPVNVRFDSEADLLQVIERIVVPLGRRLDSSQPMVDARLPDGSRINAVLGPLALAGSCLTIRKFLTQSLSFADLVQQSSLSQSAADYLHQAVVQKRNILIAGGTGSGKTTLLNTLASAIPDTQRIVTIEDAAELKLAHRNLIALEARPANAEGKGQISIRDLLVNALRMRPDRIIIGECRGAEAIDMLQAMNTGHEGSLTTLHANNPREALQRLEVMVLMAGFDMPMQAVRQQVASAIDVIVQIVRSSTGQRFVSAICEISGMDTNTIQLTKVFERSQDQLQATGIPSEWYSPCQTL